MTKRGIVFLLFLSLALPGWISGAPSGSGVALSQDKWAVVLAQFEDSVSAGAQWLEKAKSDKEKIQSDIEKMEAKAAALRKETQGGANVFGEIRLKGILNDLKAKLEENSNLQHEWDDQQKDFEQKALSLTALYNERIESELEDTDSSAGSSGLDPKLSRLTSLIRKRNQVQYLLGKYRKSGDSEKLLSLASLDPLTTHDRENLQLAMDLFNDRKRDLSDQMEKWSLEEDQARNELKLQGKMQDFLEDIRQTNEDSDLPRDGLKRNDLEGLVGKGQKNKLETRVNELQEKIDRGEKTLAQIALLMDRVQHQMDSLNERKPK